MHYLKIPKTFLPLTTLENLINIDNQEHVAPQPFMPTQTGRILQYPTCPIVLLGHDQDHWVVGCENRRFLEGFSEECAAEGETRPYKTFKIKDTYDLHEPTWEPVEK